MTEPEPGRLSLADFQALFDQIKNWGRWGADDQLGSLNLITPAMRARAAALVTDGVMVSLANPIPTTPGPGNPHPAVRAVLAGGDVAARGFGAAADLTIIAPHGSASHLDALCHVFWNGQLYNGYPAATMGSTGAGKLAISALRDGICSRGVLLDIPRVLGRVYLARGEAIGVADLEAAEHNQRVRVEEGDVLLVRTGRYLREQDEGAGLLQNGAAGLHATTMPWMKARGVALLGSDFANDVVPSGCEGVFLPVHVLALVALGLHLMDRLTLDALAAACAERGRWAFQCVVAPLVIERGTGSAVNPVAFSKQSGRVADASGPQ